MGSTLNTDSYWIHHGYSDHDSEAMLELRAKFDAAGYGLYWMLLGKMAQEGGWLSRARLTVLARHFWADPDLLQRLVDHGLEIGYFQAGQDDHAGQFTSGIVQASLVKREKKVQASRKAARKRWGKAEEDLPEQSPGNAGEMQTHSERIPDGVPKQSGGNPDALPGQSSGIASGMQRRGEESRGEERREEEKKKENTPTDARAREGLPIDESPWNPQIRPPSLEEVIEHGACIGVSKEDCEAFFLHYDGQGWKTSAGIAITNWSSKLKQWANNNDAERHTKSRQQQAPGQVHRRADQALDGSNREDGYHNDPRLLEFPGS